MPRNLNSAPLLLLLALLGGCKKEEAPAPPPPPPHAKPATAPKPAAPVQQQLSSASKLGAALSFKKDPFKPFLVPAAPAPPAGGARPSGPPAADLLPIQSFEVTKFKIAGIIAGLRENKALVLDPTGKGYVVKVGMQIGNANGRVSRITPSTVEVVEKSGRKSKTIVLTLAKKR
ncbi:pilus assembly protein PilP [Geomonas subterranea]|uniref:Pilus assembly protein PilP n=2 Tax=Geomonas subterranea TaxID=2847989 RepID=A0ABX8LIH0_9BACT|nr:pilus assembly protein PilP [Geomonas subterranea]QXE91487.1 pilus assembly protein PilP [Geomonas subterranea]QXM10425.1 pilus assembly protein PilP [Geomonas subterranea]